MLSALLALSTVLPLQDIDSKPDFVARGTFDSDWAKLKSLGVCRISAQDIGCWDMDGRYDTGLRDKALVLVQSYSSGLQFIYGKKNRYLAVEVSTPNLSLRGKNGSYQELTIHRSYREPRLSLVHVAFEPDQNTGSLFAEAYSVSQGTPVRVPFKEGQKSQFDGWSLEVGGYKSAPEVDPNAYPDGPYALKGKRWFIFLSSYFEPGSTPYRVSLGMLDKSGRPIKYVDLKGNVVSDAVYAKEMAGKPDTTYMPRPADSKTKPPKFVPVSNMTGQMFGAAQTYVVNVDPKYIGELYITRNKSMVLEMQGFPLDPIE